MVNVVLPNSLWAVVSKKVSLPIVTWHRAFPHQIWGRIILSQSRMSRLPIRVADTAPSNQMGREVLEGLRVSQSQQRPLSRKINKRIIAHPVT